MASSLPFTILIVDDDPDDRLIIDDAFNQIGYDHNVKKFATGKDLLCYLEKISPELYPSLIVLDNTLPELDALDILKLLKNNPAYKAIPVVVYSTSLSPTKNGQLLSGGAYSCITKGNTMDELLSIVKQLRDLAEGNQAIAH